MSITRSEALGPLAALAALLVLPLLPDRPAPAFPTYDGAAVVAAALADDGSCGVAPQLAEGLE
ncbi:MAG: hypothetical protein H3C38_05780 [Rhodospirillales bacterium]|nr:hypothetical protein [Rhodospirillales bacterium]